MAEHIQPLKMDDNECAKRYQETNDNKYVQMLLVKYTPIIKKTAFRIYTTYNDRYEYDDAYQEVCMNMIHIISIFDTTKGVKFVTYMYKSLKLGSFKFVRQDKYYPCNRNIRTKINPISLVADLKINSDNRCAEGGNSKLDEDTYFSLVTKSYENDVRNQDNHMLFLLISGSMGDILSKEEKFVIEQYYIEDKSQNQIAEMLGGNQTLVSRALSRARKKLKEYWNKQ